MDRLTDTTANKCCYDTWDLCGLDGVRKRDCWKPTPCKIPKIVDRLTQYEDTGLMPEEIKALQSELEQVKAERDAAVKDLYKACISTPCNTGICAKKNCHGNIIPCEFEWRGTEGR